MGLRVGAWNWPPVPIPPAPSPDPGEALSVRPARAAPPRGQRRRGWGPRDPLRGRLSSRSCWTGPNRAWSQSRAVPARRWRLQPRTCPHTSGVFPRVTAPGLASGLRPQATTPQGHVCAGSAPVTARGRARPPTPGGRDPSIAARGPPRPPGPSSGHLPGRLRRPSPPQPGRTGVGSVQGRPGHSPRSAAAALASPPAVRPAAAVRPPGALRPRPGAHGLRRPLAAGVATAPWPTPRPLPAPLRGRDPGSSPAGPAGGRGAGKGCPAGGAMGPRRARGSGPLQPTGRVHKPAHR